jgi:DNA-binding response OmpR family regulator
MSSSKPPLRVVGPGSNSAKPKWLRILIADDDRDTANMLALVLRDEGHEVQITLRGDDALDICRLFRPDVVIADVNMPGTSGYALAHELRERSGPLAPLLIAVTGVWTQPADRILGKAAGFDHYLLKPCDSKELIRLIEPLRGGQSETGASSS